MEIKGEFHVGDSKYLIFIEKRFFRTKGYLFKEQKDSLFLTPIPINIRTSTPKEYMEHWLDYLKRNLGQKRRQENSQSRGSNTRNCT